MKRSLPQFGFTRQNFVKQNLGGFTLIELIIVISLFSIIFAFLFTNVARPKVFADLAATEDLIYITIKEAQNLAMSGGTNESGTKVDFGIHLEQDEFILFQGASYNPGDPSNLETDLSPNLVIESISLPTGSDIIFSQISGEVQGLSFGVNGSFVLRETNTDETRTFTINRYGAIDVN